MSRPFDHRPTTETTARALRLTSPGVPFAQNGTKPMGQGLSATQNAEAHRRHHRFKARSHVQFPPQVRRVIPHRVRAQAQLDPNVHRIPAQHQGKRSTSISRAVSGPLAPSCPPSQRRVPVGDSSAASPNRYTTSGPESPTPDTTIGCTFSILRAPDAQRIIMFDATRAIYTHDDRKLSHSTPASIAGPQ